ncbi:MAG TPA: hypothetical protein VMK31_08325 [Sphingomicrobium sp.]|nr:hypothetical protein [Sphingomicrobium sp.]
MKEPTEHVTTTEARGGTTRHMARHALIIGTGLTVLIFAIIFFIGAS